MERIPETTTAGDPSGDGPQPVLVAEDAYIAASFKPVTSSVPFARLPVTATQGAFSFLVSLSSFSASSLPLASKGTNL